MVIYVLPLKNYEQVDITDEFYKRGYQVFVKFTHNFDNKWMTGIFSLEVWSTVVFSFLVLTLVSIFVKYLVATKYPITSSDNFFYCFGALCNQGGEFYGLKHLNRPLSFTVGLFSWILLASYSSQTFVSISQTIDYAPFKDFRSLYYETDYLLVSNIRQNYLEFAVRDEPLMQQVIDLKRYKDFTDDRSMWFAACSSSNRFAIFQKNYKFIDDDVPCELRPIGKPYDLKGIGAGVPKNFKYKKTINNG
ncbi:hypothetical protein QAD02_016870 [Eretmocerus hayati]|uniref:Uncharacterized protein n=1 Tax=Eretmocerus hayati TaxID=131215 RepID=A0ACC2PCA5_9HYME|nr:hypothetical protein QAD02_016870 [Eretmocerus hayati]